MSSLRQVSTIIEREFAEHGTLVAYVNDLMKDSLVTQYTVALRNDKWMLSFPGTKVVRQPTPPTGGKLA